MDVKGFIILGQASVTTTQVYLASGLYYKDVTIVNDASSSINKWHYNLERHFWRC